VMWKEE